MSAKLAPLMSSAKQDWQTPENVLERVRAIGPIDCDPATSRDNPTDAARFHHEGGLEKSWQVFGGGVLWLNPPFNALAPWVKRWCEEADKCEPVYAHAMMLAPARTDTRWFQAMRRHSRALCFVYGRLRFKGAPASAPFPSVIAYAGPSPALFEHVFTGGTMIDPPFGWVVRP